MLSRLSRVSLGAVLAAATFASCATVAGAVTANASGSGGGCRPSTHGVAGLTAAQAIRTVTANIPKACGFTVSGIFEGAAFGDGWQLTATSAFGANGSVHLAWVDQGTYVDFYGVGGVDYVKLSGGTVLNNDGFWATFGVTSSAVMKAAGTTRWIRLSAPAKTADVGWPLTATTLATWVAQGAQRPTATPWQLDGTATVHGIRCTVLENKPLPGPDNAMFTPQWLYVDTATGLPAQIGYYYQTNHKQHVQTSFGNWGHVAAITPPPAAEVVAG
jgi:hypothetical protein